MEIIIAIIVVLALAIWFYSRKPKDLIEAEQAEVAPYKVDEPAPAVEVAPIAEAMPVVAEAPAKKPRAPRKTATTTTKKPAAKKPKAK